MRNLVRQVQFLLQSENLFHFFAQWRDKRYELPIVLLISTTYLPNIYIYIYILDNLVQLLDDMADQIFKLKSNTVMQIAY